MASQVQPWPDDDDDVTSPHAPPTTTLRLDDMPPVEMNDVWLATTTEGDTHRTILANMLNQWIVEEKRFKVPNLFRSPDEFLGLVLRLVKLTRGDACRIALLRVVRNAYISTGAAFRSNMPDVVVGQIIASILNGSLTNADLDTIATLTSDIVTRDGEGICEFGYFAEVRDAVATAASNVALTFTTGVRFTLVRIVRQLASGLMHDLSRTTSTVEGTLLSRAAQAEAFDSSSLRAALNAISTAPNAVMTPDDTVLLMQTYATIAQLGSAVTRVMQDEIEPALVPAPPMKPLWGAIGSAMLRLWDRVSGGEGSADVLEQATEHYVAFLGHHLKNIRVSKSDLQDFLSGDVCIAAINMCYPTVERLQSTTGTAAFKIYATRLGLLLDFITAIAELVPTKIETHYAFLRLRLATGVYSPAFHYANELPSEVLLSLLQSLVKFADVNSGDRNNPLAPNDAEQKMVCTSVATGLQTALRRFREDPVATMQTLQALIPCAGGTRDLNHKVYFHTEAMRDELLATHQRHIGDRDIVQTLLVCINRIVDSTAASVSVYSNKKVVQAFVDFAKSATDDASRILPSMICALSAVKLKEHFCTTDIRDLLIKVTVTATTSEARFVGLSAITSLVHDFSDEQRQMYLSSELRQVIIDAATSGATLEEQLVVCAFVSAMCSDTKTKTSEFYCSEAVRNAIVSVAARATDEAVKCRAASCINHMVLIANRLGVRFINQRLRDVILQYFDDLHADDFRAAVINATTAMVTHDEASKSRFANPTIRDKLIGMIEGKTTLDERVRLCCVNVVCLMASQNSERRNFFDTVAMRSALLTLAEAAQSERTIEYVCFAFVTLLDNKESVKWTAARAAKLMEGMGTKVSSPTASASYLRALECLIDDPEHIGQFATNGIAAVLARFQDPLMYALTVTVAYRLTASRARDTFVKQPKFATLFSAVAKNAKTMDDFGRAFSFLAVATSTPSAKFFHEASAKLDLHFFIGAAYNLQMNQSDKFRISFWNFLKVLFSGWDAAVLRDFVAMKKSWRSSDDALWTPPSNASGKLKELIATVKDVVMKVPVTTTPVAPSPAKSDEASSPSPSLGSSGMAMPLQSTASLPPVATPSTPTTDGPWPSNAVADLEAMRHRMILEMKAWHSNAARGIAWVDPFRLPTPLSTAASMPPSRRTTEYVQARDAENIAHARSLLGLTDEQPLEVRKVQALRPYFSRPLS